MKSLELLSKVALFFDQKASSKSRERVQKIKGG
ncbi:hypothetical protein [Caudoviricetes sp.]|nr:hypothetical protein [Caudoviricetes sp.]